MAENNTVDNSNDAAAVAKWPEVYKNLMVEVSKVIVGQEDVIEQMVVAMLGRGHALLEGVPGVAKTLMVHTLAQAMNLSFHRIQFTPDLMPSDITGTDVLQKDPVTQELGYKFVKGPIFANIVLADEINRTPPKTQASMLEAMEERKVSAGGENYPLPDPFFVLATQNPLEQEGTYPLPQVQLDRFLLYIKVDYPSLREEWDIVRDVSTGAIGERALTEIKPVLESDDMLEAQKLVMRMPASEQLIGYAWSLARASRPASDGEATEAITKWINWGAGPRGVLALINCAKARALIHGRYEATVEDINWIVGSCLRHRISPNYTGITSGITSEEIIGMLLKEIPADQRFAKPIA
ncbi:MAG: MoxR family ATPase [Phycisphaerae bacterium]|jgi:MoxR-like ATPase|nr:MoxR family ATPase [Phycisphaerae bacterium]